MAAITPENTQKAEQTPPIPAIKEIPKRLRKELPALPDTKGKLITASKGFEWLDGIKDPDLLKELTIYVYRISPKILKDSSPFYIHKYNDWSEWSQNEFIAIHGGGVYKFSVNKMGEEHSIFHIKYEVDMTLYEPIIDLKVLDLASPANKAWIESQKTRGKIKQTTKGLEWTNSEEQKSIPRNGTDESTSQLIETISGIFKQSAEMNQHKTDPVLTALLTKLTNDDSNKFNIKDYIPLLLPVLNKWMEPKPQDDTLIKLLMAQAEQARQGEVAARESTNKLIEKMMEQKPTDPFAMVQKVEEVRAMFQKETPEPEKKDRFEKFMDIFATMAPALIPAFMGKMNVGMPSAMPNATMPQYPPVNMPPQQPQLVPGKPSQLNPQALLNDFNDPSTAAILANKINDETPGWLVGYQLEDIAGKGLHEKICQFDKTVILSCLIQSAVKPQLKPEISMPKLDKFVDEFINYELHDPETGIRSVVQ